MDTVQKCQVFSVVGGHSTKVSGVPSVVGGHSTKVSGVPSVVGGHSTKEAAADTLIIYIMHYKHMLMQQYSDVCMIH